MIDWQPMDTAPKDGTWVLLFFSGYDPVGGPTYKTGFWSVDYEDWYDWEGAGNSLTCFGDRPTHWAVLQEPSQDCGFSYSIGSYVEKVGEELSFTGWVVSRYLTRKGRIRYVVEVDPQGFQMIANQSQLKEKKPCW